MKHTLKRTVTACLATVMLLSALVAGGTFTASAANSQPYDFGEEYHGKTSFDARERNFTFSLSQKSHLFIATKGTGDLEISVYNAAGNEVSDNGTNTLATWNDAETECNQTHSCNLAAGSYYIHVYSSYNRTYTLTAFAESTVSLSAPVITDVSSPAGGQFSVSYSAVKNALSYEIQYSKKTNFSSATKKETPGKKYTAGGLTKGTNYYVRVRAYTVYNDGHKVYSNWSRAQAVYVRKLTNTVTVLTGSKTLKYSSLKKNNATFLVAASDKANAKFTYALSSVPSAAKKYVSINKTSGKITVKKGLKKGTYNIVVTVSAAATANYNGAKAKKTIKVKVS